MALQIVKLLDPIRMTISGTFNPMGTYNAATDYAVGDQVDYNGSSYIMYNNAAAGTVPTNTSYWGLVASKGDTGATGATGATGPKGDTGDTGPQGIQGVKGDTGDTGPQGPAGADGADGLTVSVNSVTQVAGNISLTQDNIPDGTTNKAYTAAEQTKLSGIEALADVTDATNVAAAGAIMDGDFSTNGVMTRTAAGTYTNRTITGTANQITVTNGDGVSGNPTLSLPQDIHTGASPRFAGVTTIPSGSSPTLASPYMGGSVFSTTYPANNNAGLYIRHASNTATGDRPIVGALRSRGTLNTPTAVANGDDIFSFLSAGFDGTDNQYPAEIKFVVDGTVAAGSVPTCIALRTGANGAGRVTNLRVNSNATTDIKQLQPFTDSTYTLGTSSLYWKETYTDRLYLNSTAYLDGSTAGQLKVTGLFMPVQAATASAPTYVKGAIYFDTTLNKLRVGGASGWETITSS